MSEISVKTIEDDQAWTDLVPPDFNPKQRMLVQEAGSLAFQYAPKGLRGRYAELAAGEKIDNIREAQVFNRNIGPQAPA